MLVSRRATRREARGVIGLFDGRRVRFSPESPKKTPKNQTHPKSKSKWRLITPLRDDEDIEMTRTRTHAVGGIGSYTRGGMVEGVLTVPRAKATEPPRKAK